MLPKTKAVNNERSETIGDKNKSFKGRTIERRKYSLGGSPESILDFRFGLPVSLRSLAALRARIIVA